MKFFKKLKNVGYIIGISAVVALINYLIFSIIANTFLSHWWLIGLFVIYNIVLIVVSRLLRMAKDDEEDEK